MVLIEGSLSSLILGNGHRKYVSQHVETRGPKLFYASSY